MRTNTSDKMKSEYPTQNREKYTVRQPPPLAGRTPERGSNTSMTGTRIPDGTSEYRQRNPAERRPIAAPGSNRSAFMHASGQPYGMPYQNPNAGNSRTINNAAYSQPSSAPYRTPEPRRLPAPTEYRRTGNGFTVVNATSGQHRNPQNNFSRGGNYAQTSGTIPPRLPTAYSRNSVQIHTHAAGGNTGVAVSQINKNKRGNSQVERNAAAKKRKKLITMRDFALGLIIGFAIFGPAAYFVCQTIIGIFV